MKTLLDMILPMDCESTILRSAKKFFAGTLLSRCMGMLRDVSMAFCFGCAPEVAAFMVAYRLANLFRRLLGEGNLQAGVVPHLEQLKLEGEEKAACFYRDVFYAMIMLLLLFLALGAVVCKVLAALLQSDIPMMALLMMPGVVFLCLYALNSAVLQGRQRYFLPAFAPVLFNAVWIAFAFFFRHKPLPEAMFCLSLGILVAFFCQFLVTVGPLFKWIRKVLGWKKWFAPQPFSLEVRSLAKPLFLGIIGVGAAQINSALDSIFSRLADPSGPAYLWYAIRIQQLPLALFGLALSGALLPPLSRAIQLGKVDRYVELLQSGLRKSAVLMVPCAFGMAVLAVPGLDLLYGHGGQSSEGVVKSAQCLQAYALGLVPMVYVLLLANGCYAQKEFRIPMRCSLAAVLANLFLSVLFVLGLELGAVSIALAASLSSILNCALLAYKMPLRLNLFKGLGRISLCSLAAFVLVEWVDHLWMHQRGLVSQLGRFLFEASVYGGGVLALAYLCKIDDLFALLKIRIDKTADTL